MSSLEKLHEAKSLADIAKLLGFTPRGVSYVLYKMDAGKKYRSFDIPKKSGGVRTIHAPEPRLASLQTRLSKLLYDCVHEKMKTDRRLWFASHGFHRGRTIVSNAEVHRRRRFIFNLDLENFFGTINFGRVRGFFIRDSMFSLEPKAATVIAQIACHENELPQGSPCSPIISNLVGNILDSRLLALARDARCTYTRYADDLTFSTNEKIFPTDVAVNLHGADWEVGSKLRKEIEKSGFLINPVKTRMSYRRSRQIVTGLVVNQKVNVNQDYYRTARAMCNALFQTGSYFKPGDDPANAIDNLNPLEGALSHIYFVKERLDREPKLKKSAKDAGEFKPPHAPKELYRKFLFYKYFATPKAPLIVTEGISDIIYLKCAIRSLVEKFPLLGKEEGGKFMQLVHFLKPTGTLRDILNLGNGAAGQDTLISSYTNRLEKYAHKTIAYPVIILCDNDSGPEKVFKSAGKKSGTKITEETTKPYYHLCENLYLVKVPEGEPAQPREIEDLFEKTLLETKLNGKSFDRKKDHENERHYGKTYFANRVVRAKCKTVNFSGFEPLLKRIEAVLEDYTKKPVARTAPAVATLPPPT